jgi:hypothetical protein
MRSRVPVKKEDWEAGPAMPQTNLAMRCGYILFSETFKEAGHRLSFNHVAVHSPEDGVFAHNSSQTFGI